MATFNGRKRRKGKAEREQPVKFQGGDNEAEKVFIAKSSMFAAALIVLMFLIVVFLIAPK